MIGGNKKKQVNWERFGIERDHICQWSRTRKGGWAVAQSPILTTTITLERLRKRNYESMLFYYEKVSPQFNEPLYARPACTVVPKNTKNCLKICSMPIIGHYI